MTGIAIYMEGGGDSAANKSAIRVGMSEFLSDIRESARSKRSRWKVVACGGRDAAHDAFTQAQENSPEFFNVLLVDSEEQVSGEAVAHLRARDGWALEVDADRVHLMAQIMETWLVADAEGMEQYYGQRFKRSALPRASDLESVSKADVEQALDKATERTTKGRYHKIRHASDLLKKIDPSVVRERCRYCRRLFEVLLNLT